MFDEIIRLAIKYRPLTLLMSGILLIAGFYFGRTIPIDVLPDLNKPTVTIMTEATGLAPEEVETQVTIPLERALAGVTNITRLRSVSGVGLSIIYLEFDWSSDIYHQRQLVTEKLNTVRELAKGIVPVMMPVTSIMGEIMLIGLSSQDPLLTPMDLRTYGEWVIRPQLLSIPGVAQVTAIGGEVKQYQVLAEPSALYGHKLTLYHLEQALQQFAQNTTGGYLEQYDREYLIRHIGLTTKIDDLRQTLITYKRQTPISIDQVAQVKIGAAIKRGDASINGNPAVILAIQKQPNANTLTLSQQLQERLVTLQQSLPSSLQLDSQIFRQEEFIHRSIDNVTEALRDGGILVCLILILFLANSRTTIISVLAIPLSLVISLLIFKLFDLSINTMTLGGLAIAIGELVDDAIVDVENIFRRLRENAASIQPRSKFAVVFDASREIRNSIVYATLVVILVFIPLFALGGMEGRLFSPLGIAYITSIAASLLVSLTLTPALSCYLLHASGRIVQDTWLMRHLKQLDQRLLTWSYQHSLYLIVPVLLLFFLACLLTSYLPRGFLPPFNEGTLTINTRLPAGISLSKSNEIGNLVEKKILTIPGINAVARRTGRAEQDEHAEGVNSSDIEVRFNHRTITKEALSNKIRDELKTIPGMIINIGQPISHRLDHLLSGIRAEIVIKIFGEDINILRQHGEILKQNLAEIPGLKDVQMEQLVNIPQVQIIPDRHRARLYGINVNDLIALLETANLGRKISEIREGERPVDLLLRLSDQWRQPIYQLDQMLLPSAFGPIPLAAFAQVQSTYGPNQINRENQQRRLAVFANLGQATLDVVIPKIQHSLKNLALPIGYTISLEGQYKSQQESTKRVALLGILSLGLIFIFLYTHFQSTLLVSLVLINIPLAFIGSVLALWLFQLPITLASAIGFITLAGIAARNGILKITHYLHLMRFENEQFNQNMITRGSLERLAPVLMTALVTAFALLPLLFDASVPGKEILHPVAVVIFGGLMSSTILDTLLTPVVFSLIPASHIEQLIQLNHDEGFA